VLCGGGGACDWCKIVMELQVTSFVKKVSNRRVCFLSMRVLIPLIVLLIACSSADEIGDEIDALFRDYPEYKGLWDILLYGLVDENILKTSHVLRITQMRIGKLWEKLFIIEAGFEKIPVGLDLINRERKIVMELKNSYLSDNYKSKQITFKALADFKRANPEYMVVYANINGRTDKGVFRSFEHDEKELFEISGNELLKLVLGGNRYASVIESVREKLRFKFQNL